MNEDPHAFIALVQLLEERVGTLAYYPLLDTFDCKTIENGRPAMINIQKAGKAIASHAGLGDRTFIIAVTAQSSSVAGHIELERQSSEVYVELSNDICANKDAVLATLSHEIAHKFLHHHNITNGSLQIEQEFLTDVTAVYLGMGKLMLNGSYCQVSSRGDGFGSSVTTTHTLTTGYISQACFAFVYLLICAMRKVPKEQMTVGLSLSATKAVLECERKFQNLFESCSKVAPSESLIMRHSAADSESQERCADKEMAMRNAERTLVQLRADLAEIHKLLHRASMLPQEDRFNENGRITYLRGIANGFIASQLTQDATKKLDAFEKSWKGHRIPDSSTPYESQAHLIVECPIDKTQLRLPSGKSVCSYPVQNANTSFLCCWTDNVNTRGHGN